MAGGYDYDGTGYNFVLVRYNSNGFLDTSFNSDGIVTTAGGIARSVAIRPDGTILVAGETLNGANGSDFALLRYKPDGSLDTTFGGGPR